MFKVNNIGDIWYFTNESETVGLFCSFDECKKQLKSMEKIKLKEVDMNYCEYAYPDMEEVMSWIMQGNIRHDIFGIGTDICSLNDLISKTLIQEKDDKIGLKVFIFKSGKCLVGAPCYEESKVLKMNDLDSDEMNNDEMNNDEMYEKIKDE